MVTLREIAKMANVSVGTVSRVLNDLDRVSPQTRQKVKDIIKETGYTPDNSAVSLARRSGNKPRASKKRRKSRTIGFIYWEKYVGTISLEPVYSSVMEGAQRFYQESNNLFRIRVIPKDFDCNTEPETIIDNDMDGVIMAGEVPTEIINYIIKNEIPSVHFGSSCRYSDTSTLVMPDNFNGAYTAVKHLVSLGHKYIAFISNNNRRISFTERMRGYVAAIIESKLELKPDYYCYEGQGELGGYQVMPTMLELKQPPTAFFCANDEIAFSVLKYCTEHRINIPEEISVVGFDDTNYAGYSVPALTTVRQPMVQSGVVAATELIRAITTQNYIARKIVLKTELVIRSSTGAPPVA